MPKVHFYLKVEKAPSAGGSAFRPYPLIVIFYSIKFITTVSSFIL